MKTAASRIPTKQKTGKAATKGAATSTTAKRASTSTGKKPKTSTESKATSGTKSIIQKKMEEIRKAKEARINPLAGDSPGATKSPEEKERVYTSSEEKMAKELHLTTESEDSSSEESYDDVGEENEWDGVDDLRKATTAKPTTDTKAGTETTIAKKKTVSLEEVWTRAGLTKEQQGFLKNEAELWAIGDIRMVDLSEVMTEKRYCSMTARKVIVVMNMKMEENSTDEWNDKWDIVAMMKAGPYQQQFNLLRMTTEKARAKSSAEPTQDTPIKVFKCKEVTIDPENHWAKLRAS